MRALVSLLVAAALAAAAYWFLLSRSQPASEGAGGAATQAITITGVKNDLQALAKAEQAYFAEYGKYATLDELVSSGGATFSRQGRDAYAYDAEVTASGFTVTARYRGRPGLIWPTFVIDQTMQVRQAP